MIYECTDCKYCANFNEGFRVICLSIQQPPNEVCKYFPVGDSPASSCKNFDDWVYDQHEFSWDDFSDAEKFSEEKYGEITYRGIRDWCEQQINSKK
jgi:hypothetical protein